MTVQEHCQLEDLLRRACHDNASLRDLKAKFPQREWRRFHCDLRGTVLKWRKKGSKAPFHF